MLRVISDLNLTQRIDFDADAGLLASGYQGTWVTYDESTSKVKIPGSVAPGLAWPVFNENELGDTTGGKFSPDVEELDKVTVLYGKFRGITDQYDTTNVVSGSKLSVNTDGKLYVHASGTNAVAIAVKEYTNLVYRGVTYANALEFVTI